MRSASLIPLLLTLGCAQEYPAQLIFDERSARHWAYEGDAADVNGSITRYWAIDRDRASREDVSAMNIDLTTMAPTTAAAPDVVVRHGDLSKGVRFANVYSSMIFGDAGKGEMYALLMGLGYYFKDYESISLDLLGAYIDSEIDDNGGAIGFDIVYRNHLYRGDDDDWTIFFQGGLGLQQQSTNFSGERHFNFRIQLGLGTSFEIDEDARAFVGAAYQHISDAGIDAGIDAGGGFDGPMIYAGVMFSF
jgi:hypothetical protein